MLKPYTSRSIVAVCKTKNMSSLYNTVLGRYLQQLRQLKQHGCVSIMPRQHWIILWPRPDTILSVYCVDKSSDKIKMDFGLRSHQDPQKLCSTAFLQLCPRAREDPVWDLSLLHGAGRTPSNVFWIHRPHDLHAIQIPHGYDLSLFHQRPLLDPAVHTAFDLKA